MKRYFPIIVVCIMTACLTACTNNHSSVNAEDTNIINNEYITAINEEVTAYPERKESESSVHVTNLPPSIYEELCTLEFPGIETPYVTVNNNVPLFEDRRWSGPDSFIQLSELDELGRCGEVFIYAGPELQPQDERGEIGSVKPSGWHNAKYNGYVEGNFCYNRGHLAGYQLSGLNAEPRNLCTMTRYCNVIGMLPFENAVDDYIEETGNHVLYGCVPVFKDQELVARGFLLQAYSVEDEGRGIQFCVYCFNSQPGIVIDFSTGYTSFDENYKGEYQTTSSMSKFDYANADSAKQDSGTDSTSSDNKEEKQSYIINSNTKKFHYSWCKSVQDMNDNNMEVSSASSETLVQNGYSPCKRCRP